MTTKRARKVIGSVPKTPQEQIDELVKQAEAALAAACELADKHQIGFSWDLAYGMGGWYQPEAPKMTRKQAIDKLASDEDLTAEQFGKLRDVLQNTAADADTYDWESSSKGGWQASSHSC